MEFKIDQKSMLKFDRFLEVFGWGAGASKAEVARALRGFGPDFWPGSAFGLVGGRHSDGWLNTESWY